MTGAVPKSTHSNNLIGQNNKPAVFIPPSLSSRGRSGSLISKKQVFLEWLTAPTTPKGSQKKYNWTVTLSGDALKMAQKLPEPVQDTLQKLVISLQTTGPVQKEWSHFGSLTKSKNIPYDAFHCHLKDGHPTYVTCWADQSAKKVEIFFVGTHESAPY